MTHETEFTTADSVNLKIVKKWKITSFIKKKKNLKKRDDFFVLAKLCQAN